SHQKHHYTHIRSQKLKHALLQHELQKTVKSYNHIQKKKPLYYIFYGCVNSVHHVLCVYSCSYFERYILVLL
uniref:Uncharacterized protein n=1 Tax=Dromaius novaehollandiae TaxID=8790 RepID=A0A8C4JJU3_DRONO